MEARTTATPISKLTLDTTSRPVLATHNLHGTITCPSSEQCGNTMQVPDICSECTLDRPSDLGLLSGAQIQIQRIPCFRYPCCECKPEVAYTLLYLWSQYRATDWCALCPQQRQSLWLMCALHQEQREPQTSACPTLEQTEPLLSVHPAPSPNRTFGL